MAGNRNYPWLDTVFLLELNLLEKARYDTSGPHRRQRFFFRYR